MRPLCSGNSRASGKSQSPLPFPFLFKHEQREEKASRALPRMHRRDVWFPRCPEPAARGQSSRDLFSRPERNEAILPRLCSGPRPPFLSVGGKSPELGTPPGISRTSSSLVAHSRGSPELSDRATPAFLLYSAPSDLDPAPAPSPRGPASLTRPTGKSPRLFLVVSRGVSAQGPLGPVALLPGPDRLGPLPTPRW